MKVGLICSSGGHFFQLYLLREYWEEFDRFWVTFLGSDTKNLLEGEKTYWAYSPTNRNIKNFFRNLYLAINIIRKEKPDVIISTGAGVAVPFLCLGRLLGKKTIYIESLTRIRDISLSGKLVYPVVDTLLVQWEELGKKYKKAKFVGQVI